MKTSLTLIVILSGLIALSQTVNDKIILKKEEYGEVYITHDTLIREYSWLVPQKPQLENLNFYNQYYAEITKGTNFIKHHLDTLNLPVKWTPLYKIDEKYYLYGPSDWMSSFGFVFCDSTIIKQYSDGPDVYVILDAQKISNKQYQFKTITYNKVKEKITIFILDKQNEIAVWKFESENGIRYDLMVNSNYVKRFPIVICDCGDRKCYMEYDFQSVDYEKIIKEIN